MLILIILLFFIIIFFYTYDNFEDNLWYYCSNLNDKDLYYRQCNDSRQYFIKYTKCLSPLTSAEKQLIDKFEIIYNKICPKKFHVKSSVRKICYDKTIEYGAAHTIGNVIIFPDIYFTSISLEEQLLLYIHEKIHIYQKEHKTEFEHYLKEQGFTKIPNKKPSISNPDTEGLWMKDGKIYETIYDEKTNLLKEEHPYEIFCFDFADYIMNKNITN